MYSTDRTTEFIKQATKTSMGFFQPLIVLIVSVVFFITIPLLNGFVALAALPFGNVAAYIATQIFTGLYIPALVVALLMIALLFIKFIKLCLMFGGKINLQSLRFNKSSFKSIAVVLVLFIAVIGFSFNSVLQITNAILDIPNAAKKDYSVTEGILTMTEKSTDISTVYIVHVNGINFDGKASFDQPLDEGEKYRVEYLPHSKYIVTLQKAK